VAIDYGNVAWLNEVSASLSVALSDAALAASSLSHPVKYVDPAPYFAGHNICSTNAPGLNGIVLSHTPGDLPFVPTSAQPIHPNPTGTTYYAQAMTDGLNGVYP
jgi:hypothetical protein